ncbi:hypothetical protein ACHWQZ_G009382 [Mnemiopsis leidyi]
MTTAVLLLFQVLSAVTEQTTTAAPPANTKPTEHCRLAATVPTRQRRIETGSTSDPKPSRPHSSLKRRRRSHLKHSAIPKNWNDRSGCATPLRNDKDVKDFIAPTTNLCPSSCCKRRNHQPRPLVRFANETDLHQPSGVTLPRSESHISLVVNANDPMSRPPTPTPTLAPSAPDLTVNTLPRNFIPPFWRSNYQGIYPDTTPLAYEAEQYSHVTPNVGNA